MKKFFALVLAVMMIMSLAIPAMAADTPVSVTVSHIEAGHTFTAYQILDGDVYNRTLSNITWGKNVDSAVLLNTLKNDTTTMTDPDDPTFVYSFGTDFATVGTAVEFATKISSYASNNIRIQHLANLIAETTGILIGDGTDSVMDPIASQAGAYTYTISNLEPGYYIIIDTTKLVDDPNTPDVDESKFPASDFRTNYLVNLTSATNVSTKGSTTTTDKTVSPTIDGTYDAVLAAELNEVHYYKLETDINDRLDDFDKYTLISYDQMTQGLTFLALEEVYVQNAQGSKIPLGTKQADGTFLWGTNPQGTSYAPDHPNTSIPAANTDGAYLALGWTNTKATMPSLQGDDKLVIKYSAKMNEHAVLGIAGNLNEHYVDATNGPGDTDIGQTIHDKTRVFTFQLDVLKVDANDKTKTLEGAEFYLTTQRLNAAGTGNTTMYARFLPVTDATTGAITYKLIGWAPYYAENIQKQIEALDTTAADYTTQLDALKAILNDPTKLGTKLVTKADGKLNVDGLNDATQYSLLEVKAPEGYNLPLFATTSFSFEYTTRVDANGQPTWSKGESTSIKRDSEGVPVVTGLRANIAGEVIDLDPSTASFTQALGSVNIENNQGNVLPSTGGMGTTMLYLFGTIMTLGAAVLLITKRRMNIA